MQQNISQKSSPITVTENAINKIKSSTADATNKMFRISIVSGGCSGFSTEFIIEDTTNYNEEDDFLLEISNIKIAFNKNFITIINGGILDFTSNLIGDKFTLKIPNSKDACGCGSSFSI
jgi:iron-sulfur cluster insertion protein